MLLGRAGPRLRVSTTVRHLWGLAGYGIAVRPGGERPPNRLALCSSNPEHSVWIVLIPSPWLREHPPNGSSIVGGFPLVLVATSPRHPEQ